MEDYEIIELYFARNEQAIAETDAKYGRKLNGIADNVTKNHEDAEECVNDAYLAVTSPGVQPESEIFKRLKERKI